MVTDEERLMGDEACMMRHVCPRCDRVHDAHDPAAQCRGSGDSTDRSEQVDGPCSESKGRNVADRA